MFRFTKDLDREDVEFLKNFSGTREGKALVRLLENEHKNLGQKLGNMPSEGLERTAGYAEAVNRFRALLALENVNN